MTSSRHISPKTSSASPPGSRGILVAGAGSGSGKTLATLALLSGLLERGLDVLPYKCGPDFIDPRHHERVALTPSRNLDLHFTPPDPLRQGFDRELSGRSGAVVEGVMGLFDGLAGGRSTFDLAQVLELPVVLVLSARGMAETAAALVRGLVSFREGLSFAGVIATRTGSARHGEMIARALEAEGLPPLLGVLPRDPLLELPERYLGLSAPGEEGEEKERLFLERLSEHARRFQWERILPFFAPSSSSSALQGQSSAGIPSGHQGSPVTSPSRPAPEGRAGNNAPENNRQRGDPRGPWAAFLSSLQDRAVRPLPGESPMEPSSLLPGEKGEDKGGGGAIPRPPRLAVALDRAFWFYYHENWEELRKAGIEIVFFSPLEDTRLPAGTSGLYFGGGYPESFARALSQNRSMVESVRDFCLSGRPVYAECGGMLYLTRGPVEESLIGNEGGEGEGEFAKKPGGRSAVSSPDPQAGMVGVLPVRYRMGERLRRLGYSEVEAASGLFAGVPGPLRGHLFHYTTLVEDVLPEGDGQPAVSGRRGGSQGGSGESGGGGADGKGLPANAHRGRAASRGSTSSSLEKTSAARFSGHPGSSPDRSGSSFRDRRSDPFPTLSEPAFRHTEDGRLEGFSQGGVIASYMHAFLPSNPLYAARLAERLRS